MKKGLLLFLIFLSGIIQAQNHFPTQEPFGKNRIQYRSFEWKVLTTQNFEIYFYDGGQETATLAANLAESEFDRVTDIIGYSPFTKTKLFIYTSVQDLNQSNVGLSLGSDRQVHEENLAKARIELAYSGNALDFKKDIVREMAKVYVYDMLYGGSLKESFQNSLLLSVPEWFTSGIAAYISDGWTTEMDAYMNDAIQQKYIRRPSLTKGQEATLVGQSIWNFIVERYGKDNISNILNLTRIIRNEQTSVASTLGLSYVRFLKEWRDYYSDGLILLNSKYQAPALTYAVLEKDMNSLDKINSFKINAEGTLLAYSQNELGRATVTVMNLKTKEKATVFTTGHKTLHQSIDKHTPLLSWTKGGTLAIVYEEEGKVMLNLYTDVSEKDLTGKYAARKVLGGFTQVTDFDINDNGTSIALSGLKKGQNDLYLFDVARGGVKQLTNDLFDDLSPQFVGNAGKLIFVSNRKRDSLNVDKPTFKQLASQYNLCLHDGKEKSDVVKILVDSLGTISKPVVADGGTVYFLSDEKGVKNIYRLIAGENSPNQVSIFRTDVNDFDYTPKTNSLVYSFLENGKEILAYLATPDLGIKNQAIYSQRNVRLFGITQEVDKSPNDTKVVATLPKASEVESIKPSVFNLEKGEIDTDNYQFETSNTKATSTIPNTTTSTTSTPKTDKKTKAEKLSASRLNKKDNIKIKGPVDYNNPFVVNGTESDFVVDPLPQRGIGLRGALNMNDLLENHHLKTGMFITPNLKNLDLWAEYAYLAKRIDYKVRFDRRVTAEETDSTNRKYKFNRLAFSASYPFSTNARLTFTTSYTVNRFQDMYELNIPDKVADYAGAGLEFVFDNTISYGLNQLAGTRFRARLENYLGMVSKQDGYGKFYIDLRHYQRFGKGFTLAGRLSGGTSFGESAKQTVMGGMDNWLNCTYETRNNVNNPFNTNNTSGDLYLLDYSTPLRGFNANKMSGTNSVLVNLEARLPIAKYLYNGPIHDNFFKNLQLIAFTDIGTAWIGTNPFARKNGFNTYELPATTSSGSSAYRVTVTDFRSPFLIGYGFGARTTVLGYFFKFDLAWGIEDKTIKTPVSYWTLGYDF